MLKGTSTLSLIFMTAIIASCGNSSGDKNQSSSPAETAAASIDVEQIPEDQLLWNDGNEKYQFRKTWWGMNREEVMAAEANPPADENDMYVVYKDLLFGLSCFYGYELVNDSLLSVRIIFDHKRAELTDYIDDYHRLVSAMTYKYGEPRKDTVQWIKPDSIYMNDTINAYLAENVLYFADWFFSDTHVMLTNRIMDGQPELGIKYVLRASLRKKTRVIFPDSMDNR